jgi:hypothetical protein
VEEMLFEDQRRKLLHAFVDCDRLDTFMLAFAYFYGALEERPRGNSIILFASTNTLNKIRLQIGGHDQHAT